MSDDETLTAEEILALITYLAESDVTEEAGMERAQGDKSPILTFVSDVYEITHAFHEGICHHVHGRWRREAVARYDKLAEAGLLPPRGRTHA